MRQLKRNRGAFTSLPNRSFFDIPLRMSLGSQLAPHLPFLRRFGRSLTGNQSHGDAIVQATLESIGRDYEVFPRDVKPKVGLYRMFIDQYDKQDQLYDPQDGNTKAKIALNRLSYVTILERKALLLVTMEEFSIDDVSYIMGIPNTSVDKLVSSALQEIERQAKTSVLIIEDDPMQAMDLELIVRDLGHKVADVAVTRADAVLAARENKPGLVIADIQLADDSSGIDAVKDILNFSNPAVIFVTAYPERLLTGERLEPTYLITKPWQRSTLKAAISQALFFHESAEADEPLPLEQDLGSETALSSAAPDPSLAQFDKVNLSSVAGPLDAEVIDGRLARRVSHAAATLTPLANIEVLRQEYLNTAVSLANELAGVNAGPALNRRLVALKLTLSSPFDEASGTSLGVQARGLSQLILALADSIMESTRADLEVFATDLGDLAWQFPLYRDFLSTAQSTPILTDSQRDALVKVAKVIEVEPDEAVASDLKVEVASLRESAEGHVDVVADLALQRGMGNLLRGLGRYLQQRGKGIAGEAGKEFDEKTGKAIGDLISRLIVSGALVGVATYLPGAYAWILTMIAAANAVRK